MGAVLGLLSALCYGTSDFFGGAAGRRVNAGVIAMIAQPISLLAAIVAVAVLPHGPADAQALGWGAISGIGSGVGTVTLYLGLSRAPMGVVSPISAVMTALIPVSVGVLSGERPGVVAVVGLVLAFPAVVLVSLQGPQPDHPAGAVRGIVYGLLAGGGFGLLYVGLAQAGTHAGAWPLVPGQTVGCLVIIAWAWVWSPRPVPWGAAWRPALLVGFLAGLANLFFLAATGAGALTIVAVLGSLYPAVTVLLARFVLHERWRRPQVVGLVLSGAAVVLITLG